MNPWLIALQAGLAVAKYIPFFVVGIQHLMPHHSGQDKMNAVLGMMLAGGAAAGEAVPAIADQSNLISQTLTGVVQSVYDGIKQNQPQALLVHPDNTAGTATALAPSAAAPAAPAPPQAPQAPPSVAQPVQPAPAKV